MTRLDRELLSLQGLRGEGKANAIRVWLVLWSHVSWVDGKGKGEAGFVWLGNDKIAAAARCSVREVRRAIALLRSAGKISTRMGRAPGSSKCTRVITLAPSLTFGVDDHPAFALPSAPALAHVAGKIKRASGPGARTGETFSLALAVFAIASLHARGAGDDAKPRAWGSRPGSTVTLARMLPALRDLTGCAAGSDFNRRLDLLESAGVIKRAGRHWSDGIEVEPVDLPDDIALGVRRVTRVELPARPMMSCRPTPALADQVPFVVPEVPTWFVEHHAHAVDDPGWESGVSMSV